MHRIAQQSSSPRRRRLAAAIGSAALLSTPVPAHASRAAPTLRTTVVHVVVQEGSFTFSRASAPTGVVVFAVINRGTTAHELLFPLLGRHTRVLVPGASTRLVITFEHRGRYFYICPRGEHMETGEAGSFRVR